MRRLRLKKLQIKKHQVILVAGIILGFAIIVVVVLLLWPKPLFSRKLINAYPADVLVPGKDVGEVVRGTPTYDSKLQQLTYTLDFGGATIIVSEQPTPETFTDVPALYDQLTTSMKQYKQFSTDIGTVYLTAPDNLHGLHAAVANVRGTLLLTKPDHNISDDQWRQLMGHFTVQR